MSPEVPVALIFYVGTFKCKSVSLSFNFSPLTFTRFTTSLREIQFRYFVVIIMKQSIFSGVSRKGLGESQWFFCETKIT